MNFSSLDDLTNQLTAHPRWDIIVLLILVTGGFFYGISTGKARIAARILYTYAAFAVVSAFPLKTLYSQFYEQGAFFAEAALFLFLFLALSLFLGTRKFGPRFLSPSDSWLDIFLLSFLQIGLLIHLVLQFVPPENIDFFAPITKTIFANQNLHFWWLFIPLAVLVTLKRKDRRNAPSPPP